MAKKATTSTVSTEQKLTIIKKNAGNIAPYAKRLLPIFMNDLKWAKPAYEKDGKENEYWQALEELTLQWQGKKDFVMPVFNKIEPLQTTTEDKSYVYFFYVDRRNARRAKMAMGYTLALEHYPHAMTVEDNLLLCRFTVEGITDNEAYRLKEGNPDIFISIKRYEPEKKVPLTPEQKRQRDLETYLRVKSELEKEIQKTDEPNDADVNI